MPQDCPSSEVPMRSLSIDWNRTFGDSVAQRGAFDKLHDQRADSLFEAVNLRDVEVVQRRKRLRFTLEARETLRVGRK